MKFNEIVKWKTSIGDFPCTRKFDSDNLPVDDSSKKHLRVWNSFKSTLSAAIICGLEVMPINKTTNILYIGTLNDDIKLNFLDLVENNQEIIVLNENNPKTNDDYNPAPTRNANIKYVNSLEQIQGKFLVIYIDDIDFTLEKIANLSNQFLMKYQNCPAGPAAKKHALIGFIINTIEFFSGGPGSEKHD